MSGTRRRKRAAPDQLYKHCIQGGDCIPDVQNKFEQKTWADTLLKIFGSLLYFGNLGIGTGRGSGGSLGYRPLGTPSTRPTDVTPIRPNITIDAVGPSDVIPIDAATPSIVPLSEGTPNIGYIAPDAGPGLGGEDIELYTITNPTTNIGGAETTPTIVTTDEGAAAVIETQFIPERPVQAFYDPAASTTHEINIFTAPSETTSNVNVFVDPEFSGTIVGGFDEIPLQRLNYSEFEIEESPITSTPAQKVESAISKAKGFYNRFIKQVPIKQPEFLTRPSQLVQFEFDNPAFDDDVSFEFERDLAAVSAAPAEEFQDVIRLHRPSLSSYEGLVRVSRLADTGVMETRSGTVIGPRIHFYQDISAISPVETIELQDVAGPPTLVDELLEESVFIDPINTADNAVTENDLIDEYEETFADTHLVVATSNVNGELETNFYPSFAETLPSRQFIPDISTSTIIDFTTPKLLLPSTTYIPLTQLKELYPDFSLYPSNYYFKKRRRVDLDLF